MAKKTQTATTSSSPPSDVLSAYQQLMSRAQGVASTPYQPYPGSTYSPLQSQAFQSFGNIPGQYLPTAEAMSQQGAASITPGQIQNYSNPFQQQVVNATMGNINETNAQQHANLISNAIPAGGLNNDRLGVAEGELARQQDLASNQTFAGLNAGNYQQALQAAQADRSAQAQGAYQQLGIANTALQGAGAQLGAGSTQYGQPYAQWQQQQAFPYQQTGWLAGLETGVGGAEGGTSQTTQPGPNPLAQWGGLGLAGLGVAGGLGWKPFSMARGGAIKGYAMGGNPYSDQGYIPSLQIGRGMGLPRAPNIPQQQSGAGNMISNAMSLANKMKSGSTGQDFGSIPNPNAWNVGGESLTGTGIGTPYIPGDTFGAIPNPNAWGSLASGGAIPGYDDGGKIYSENEPSPLDPPSGLDRDQAIRTIYGEGSQSPEERLAIANVIRNRAVDTGAGIPGVVHAKNQFEAWDRPEGIARMNGLSPNDPQYQQIGQLVDKAYAGDDPTRGARNFYSPGAQAALGRQPPAWAQGEGQKIGQQAFYGGIPSQSGEEAGIPLAQNDNEETLPENAIPAQATGTNGSSWSIPLIAAGFGMMASRSPFLGTAIGEGGMQGLQAYSGQQQAEMKQRNVDLQAKRLDQQADQAAERLKLQTSQLAQTTKHQDAMENQGKYTLIPGQGVNPETGETVPGSYKLNTKTGEQVFVPGVVQTAKPSASSESSLAKDDDTRIAMAQQYLAGDKSVLTNLGRGAQGFENMHALRKEIATQGKAMGLDPSGIANKIAEFSGQVAGQRTLGNRTANVEMAVSEAQKMMPLALDASKNVDRTNYPTLNSIILAAEKGTGDENVVRLGIATNSLINIYARAISPTGVPTVSDKDHARELLSGAWSKGQYAAGVDQLGKEMEAARQSPMAVQQKFREMYGTQHPQAPQTATPAAPSVTTPPATIPPIAERVTGQTYQTPKGPAIWRGSGWELAQ